MKATLCGLTILACLQSSKQAMALSSVNSCAVYGVGVLGTSLCRQILESSPDTQVVGITKTSNRHDDIRRELDAGSYGDRLTLVTTDDISSSDEKFDNVIFCAPPSGFENYPKAVKDATENIWAGKSGGGMFLFTSSGGIYGPGNGETITEDSPLADPNDSPRIARLIHAEDEVRAAGGCCIRLAGLYNLARGPHNFWLTSGKDVSGGPDGIVNMLHYDDAAGACLAALMAGPGVCSGKHFLISDGHPLSRRQICEAALQAEIYKKYAMPNFLGSNDQNLGKVYDGSRSNAALNWKPQYESMFSFFAEH